MPWSITSRASHSASTRLSGRLFSQTSDSRTRSKCRPSLSSSASSDADSNRTSTNYFLDRSNAGSNSNRINNSTSTGDSDSNGNIMNNSTNTVTNSVNLSESAAVTGGSTLALHTDSITTPALDNDAATSTPMHLSDAASAVGSRSQCRSLRARPQSTPKGREFAKLNSRSSGNKPTKH